MLRRSYIGGARLFISFWLVLFSGCEYLPVDGGQVAGGGSHTGDDTVLSGSVTDPQGTVLGKVSVLAVPEDYKPGPDAELEAGLQVESDVNGKFSWASLPNGRYNIFAKSLESDLSGYLGTVDIQPFQYQTALKGILRPSGTIRIPIESLQYRDPGKIYFRGSPFYGNWEGHRTATQDFLLENLPTGILHGLEYESSIDPGKVEALADSVVITEGENHVTDIPLLVPNNPVDYPLQKYGVTGESLNDFPYLLRLDASNFPFEKDTLQKSGLYVVDENGKVLPHSIVSWDLEKQKAELYVNLKNLDLNAESPNLKIGWSKDSSYFQNNFGQVFNYETGYLAVVHGDKDLDIFSLLPWDFWERSSFPYLFEDAGIFTTEGMVGKSLNLSSLIYPNLSEHHIVEKIRYQMTWSFSMWFKPLDVTNKQALFSMTNWLGSYEILEWGIEQGKLYMTEIVKDELIDVSLEAGQWQHLQVNVTDSSYAVFLNGEQVTTGALEWSRTKENLGQIYMGYGLWEGSPSRFFTGQLDEWRLSLRGKTPTWAMLSYLNQKSP